MVRVALLFVFLILTAALRAADPLPVEQQLADTVKSPGITVVHFWATWCPNCAAEMANGGWRDFIAKNPAVNFVFVRAWDEKPGAPVLARHGLGAQKNLLALEHPNPSRKDGQKLERILDLPLMWLPTTWVFRHGRLRYAINYGEVRFPMLQQLVDDAPAGRWDK